MHVRPRSVASFVALLSLVASLVVPAVSAASAAPVHNQRWIAEAPEAAALNQALAAHSDKIPVEFFDRLKYSLPDGTLRVMVALDQRDAAIENFVARNTTWVQWYGSAPRFLGRVTQSQMIALLNARNITFVEPDYPIKNFMASSTLDVHARSQNGDGTGVWSYDPAGDTLKSDVPGLSVDQATGKGVTVAITDSGIDKTFRDFSGWGCEAGPYQACNSRVVKIVTISHIIDAGADPGDTLPTTDFVSGHGTHVAGTIGGNAYYGRDSAPSADDKTQYGADGLNFGIAPQVNLLNTKNGDSQSAGLSSFGLQWQLDHAAEYGIKVSSNSWGCTGGCTFDPNSVDAQLYRDMYNAGITVVFAAGNDGGTNSGTAFSGDAQSPYVLGVAAYDDTNHQLASFSSRGKDNTLPDPTTWTPQSEGTQERRPDVAAPGVNIWSAGNLTGGTASLVPRQSTSDVTGGDNVCCTREYRSMSGTSMATPHVAGAVALLAGACPNAGPLDYMRAIMAGANPSEVLKTGSSSAVAEPFERGYGSLEIRSSLDWLRNQTVCGGTGGGGTGPSPTPTTTPTPSPTSTSTSGGGGTGTSTTYYLHSASGFGNADYPVGGSTFDKTAPTFDSFSSYYDVPILIGNGQADPAWDGTVDETINQLSVDFWQRTPVGTTTDGTAQFDVHLNVGDTVYDLPMIDVPTDAAPDEVSEVKATFTELLDGTPLNIDPAGQPVTLRIRGHFVNSQAITEIDYDSIDMPASFTVTSGTGGGTDPSPTPTPTNTEPPPPPPAGDRGTYPTTPNDTYFGPGSNIDPAGATRNGEQWGPQKINAPQAWQEQQATGYGVRVGVLDSGLDLGHPDLQCPGKIDVVANSDLVDNDSDPSDGSVGHGTHVAGIIGACTNNNEGIAGVAPDVTLVPIRVLDETGSGSSDQIAAGVDRAVAAGVDVINMSLGQNAVSKADLLDNSAFDQALSAASDAGVVVVAAAGNDATPLCDYPALHEDVVCVVATDRRDNKSWYSAFDDKIMRGGPMVSAPGGAGSPFCDIDSEEILSLYDRAVDAAANDCDGRLGYTDLNGTSMATPHVAGVAALIYDRLGGIRSPENRQAVIDALTGTAVDLGVPGEDPVYGSGRVDALAAVKSVDPVAPPAPVAAATSVNFTDASATSAQYSDTATIAAKLVDDQGNAINNADLTFALVGGNGTRDWTVKTDNDGVASRNLTFTDDPGSYQLTVRYAGEKDAYLASANVGGFVIGQDGSATALKVLNKGSDTKLSSNTNDADSASGLAGVTVEYFADGNSIGTATTDATGLATLAIPSKYRNGHHNYEVVFSGNKYYERSSAKQKT